MSERTGLQEDAISHGMLDDEGAPPRPAAVEEAAATIISIEEAALAAYGMENYIQSLEAAAAVAAGIDGDLGSRVS